MGSIRKAPAFFRVIVIGVRHEWDHWSRSHVMRIFAALVIALGVLTGSEFVANPGSELVFGSIKMSMFLTIGTAYWCWWATSESLREGVRELLVIRAADESALQLARLVTIGFLGGLISVVFSMATLFHSLDATFGLGPYVVKWTPIVIFGHIFSAAVGSVAALLSARKPQLGIFLTAGIWVGLLLLPSVWVPDPLLRSLHWHMLLRDHPSLTIYSGLVARFLLFGLLIFVVGMGIFGLLMRTRMRPTIPATSYIIVGLGLASLFVLVWASINASDARLSNILLDDVPVFTMTADRPAQLVWQPKLPMIHFTDPEGTSLGALAGPVASGERYIGRLGFVLPLKRFVTRGSYDFFLRIPEGWIAYGCSRRVVEANRGLRCFGDFAERDWIAVLRQEDVQKVSMDIERFRPEQARANALFREKVARIFFLLDEPHPNIFPLLAGTEPWWFADHTIALPIFDGYPPSHVVRKVAHHLALLVADYLTRDVFLDQNTRLALLATIDRLVLELGGFELSDDERSWRGGGSGDINTRLPRFADVDFNYWWNRTDELLEYVGSEEVWAAVATLHGGGGLPQWRNELEDWLVMLNQSGGTLTLEN